MSFPGPNPLNYQPGEQDTIKRIRQDRAPTTQDIYNVKIGDEWLDTSSDDWYKLVSLDGNSALWVRITTDFPITPYVVGPETQAGFTTIQSAINAANDAGGGLVYVQNGTYTEDLTLYDGVLIRGHSNLDTTIVGSHTPPTSGTIGLYRLKLQDSTAVLNSASAGTTAITIEDCNFAVTNGYAINLANWLGTLTLKECSASGTTDGGINNTAGMTVTVTASTLGVGSGNTMNISGVTQFSNNIDVNPPVNFQSTGTLLSSNTTYNNTVTISGSFTAEFSDDAFNTGSSPCLTQSSSSALLLDHVSFDTSSDPVINGAGSGAVTIAGGAFLNGINIDNANTLTFGTGTVVRTTQMVIGPQGGLSHTINAATFGSDLEIHSESSQDLGGITIHRHTDTALWGGHIINLRSDGTHASPTIVASGDVVSRYLSCGYDGTDYAQLAEIRSEVDGTPGTNDMPGRWIFSTSADGTQVPSEALRLSQDQSCTFAGAFTFPTTDGTSGQVLVTDGAGSVTWQSAAGDISSVNIQTFTASGTYTPTTNMKYAIIELVGGGGGGGAVAQTTGPGLASSGGAGGYSRVRVTSAQVGSSQTVTIGAGGAGGAKASPTTGTTGGTTSVGTLCVATGGTGGAGASGTYTYSIADGGVGTTGDVLLTGEYAQPNHPNGTLNAPTGRGGNSYFGIGAKPLDLSVNSVGNNAVSYGGGGGGANEASGTTGYDGGAGADGYVVITEYVG